MNTPEADDSQSIRKTPIERLSHEELVKKYRQAILIAQKAKESKSEFLKHIAQQEDLVRSLEEKLKKCEIDKKAEADLRLMLEAELKNVRDSLESAQGKGSTTLPDVSANEKLKLDIERFCSDNAQLASELETSKVKIVTQETELLKVKEELGEVSDLKAQLEKVIEAKENETKILQDTLNTEKETFEKCHQELCQKLKYFEESLEREHEQRNDAELKVKQDILNLEDLLKKKDEDLRLQELSINEQKLQCCTLERELEEKKSLLEESCEKIAELRLQLTKYEEIINSKPTDEAVEQLTAQNSKLEKDLVQRNDELCVKTETLNQCLIEQQEMRNKLVEIETLSSKYASEVKLLQLENSDLSQKVLSLQTEISELNCQLVDYKKIMEDKAVDDTTDRLTSENTNLLHEIASKNKEITLKEDLVQQITSELQQMKEDHSKTKSELFSKVNNLEQENNNLSEQILSLENAKEKLNSLLHEMQEEVKEKQLCLCNMQEQLEKALATVTEKQEHIVKLEALIAQLESEIETQKQQDINECSELCSKEKTKLQYQVRERDDKLSKISAEMSQISSELSKLKGTCTSLETEKQELIQKLADTCDMLEKKESEVGEMKQKFTDKEEFKEKVHVLQNTLGEKESIIQELEQEIFKLRDAAANESTNTEISSTFSLSRAEEMSRMKDLEDSFEDKYTKLRVVAVKLKKRVTDLTQTLETERSKATAEKLELQTKLSQLAAHAKTVQTLQSEVDRLQDLLEEQKRAQQQLNKDLESAVKEAASKKFELASVQEELSQAINDKKGLQTSLASLESCLSQTETVQTEMEKLRKELKEKDLSLEAANEEKKKLSEQLEKVCADAKKKSVLSLEMADMEKSVTELNRQLSAERERLKKSESDLEQAHSLLLNFESQCKKFQENLTEKEEIIIELKELLNKANGKAENLNLRCRENEETIEQLSSQLERERSNIEELNIQYSDLAAKEAQTKESARLQIEALGRQVFQLEEQCSSLNDNNKAVEDELSTLKKEFENYKVRAQSVLRQSAKQEDRSLSASTVHDAEELEVEVERLRVSISNLKDNLKQTTSQLQAMQQEVNVEREEKMRAVKQAQSSKESCVQAVERLHVAEERLSVAAEEAKQAKLHSDMLIQCYKQQIEDLKTTHQKKVASLTEQIENLQMSIKSTSTAPENERAPSAQSAASPVSEWTTQIPNVVNADSDLAIRLSSLHREEGEGSESVDSFPSRRISVTNQDRRHELVPLDKLLSSTTYPEDEMREVGRANSSDLNVDLLQSKLCACESRAAHLTALLSEAESDAARLSELNSVLKEEIRRQQRSEERAQHAHNLEYLKNIVVKFITLQNGDERQRLVPVLNTILKLSPEEANLIDSAAKGASPANSAARGWGSYLPLPGWTGS
ncbi:GRIP and coiled-coil domain-containing protein 2 [Frankliniella fusca]|uniref:GRIP and coiled-coil domain-containing protein 2 n=1 Tax=Frankliniella fusca TaxID=407009 RepID=A0AAE1H739_9NEOP|nr:GRIP and coiled-coil domain-containing protein 2 [Frankliniella fusca]